MNFSSTNPEKLLKDLNKFLEDKITLPKVLSEEDALQKETCEASFYEFIKKAWFHVEGRYYKDGWFVQAMAEHLEALYYLQIKKLIINAPIRIGKTNILNVLFPAWVWTKNPNLSFLCAGYSQELSGRSSRRCRELILSEWFQNLWGDEFRLRVKNDLFFNNNKGGYRETISIGGRVTGLGGDFGILDDPHNANDVHSDTQRKNVHDWFNDAYSNRYRDKETQRLVVNCQRLHMDDLVAHLLERDNQGGYTLFCTPMEFEKSRRCVTIPLPMSEGKVWKDPRKKEGELLFPELVNNDTLKEIKEEFNNNSYTIASQLQQRPSPVDGGLIQKDWFKIWREKEYPNFECIIQSWDTALTDGKHSCFSACTTWGVFKDKSNINNIILLSVFKEKVKFPELRKMAVRLYNNYNDVYIDHPIYGENKPDLVIIERKVSGYSLIDELMRAQIPVVGFDPGKHGNKIGRCLTVTHLIENGLVWLPTDAPYHKDLTDSADIFLEAALLFPNDKANDVIDSMSQAFIRLSSNGWVANTSDPVIEEYDSWHKNRPYT